MLRFERGLSNQRHDILSSPHRNAGAIINLPDRTYAELDAWYRRQGSSLSQRSAELFGSGVERVQQALLTRARQGGKRPLTDTRDPIERKLGLALMRYTHVTGKSFDPVFTKQIRECAPQWFEDSGAVQKLQLLKRAKLDKRRPSSKAQDPIERKLGMALSRYTCTNGAQYDPVFDKKIRKRAPQWFGVVAKKQRLLKHADRGAKRPLCTTQLGRALFYYCSEKRRGRDNSGYDPIFHQEILERAPQWFLES